MNYRATALSSTIRRPFLSSLPTNLSLFPQPTEYNLPKNMTYRRRFVAKTRRRAYRRTAYIRRNYNRKFTYPTSRRRRAKKKVYYFENKKGAMSKRRESVGLPPLELKKVIQTNTFSGGQYATFVAATTWSASHDFTDIAIGESTSTRTSQNITILPFTYTLNCYQALSNTVNYRFLLIKVYDQIDVNNVNPDTILQDTTSVSKALISQYKDSDDRTFKFKILKDRFYTWSTYSGHTQTYKRFFFKFKTKNKVRYDPDDATGDTATGHLLFVMITDATPASGSFTRGGSYTMKFLDM